MDRVDKINEEIVNISELEYRRFLTLTIENPEVRLAPTPLMDLFWHAHILDTVSYAVDCDSMFGKFLHHIPNFGPFQKKGVSFDEGISWKNMCRLYRERFGEEPICGGVKDGINCSVDQCHTNCGAICGNNSV